MMTLSNLGTGNLILLSFVRKRIKEELWTLLFWRGFVLGLFFLSFFLVVSFFHSFFLSGLFAFFCGFFLSFCLFVTLNATKTLSKNALLAFSSSFICDLLRAQQNPEISKIHGPHPIR